MNKLQMRQTLETLLGYYQFTKDRNGVWSKSDNPDCPGFYYFEGELFKPAFFMEGSMKVPPSWDVKGLETILIETPKVRNLNRPGGILERWQTWTVWMRQWDESKSIDRYQNAVLRHFGGDATATTFLQNDNELKDRIKFTITTKDWDLATYVDGALVSCPPSPIENSPEKCYYDQ